MMQPQGSQAAGRRFGAAVDDILLPRAAQLQAVAVVQRFCQQHLRQPYLALAGYALHRADVHARAGYALGVHHLRVARAKGIAGKERTRKYLRQRLALRRIGGSKAPGAQRVQRATIGAGDDCHILGPLEPPLDFKRAHPSLGQRLHLIAQAQIARGQPRARFPLPGIGQSARLGAAPAVAAAPADQPRVPALTADAYALRAMDKHLGFHPGIRHGADGVQRTLARQHHAAHAKRTRQARARRVMQCHLRAGMQAQVRKLARNQAEHAQILHQHRVGAQIRQHAQGIAHAVQFALLHQRVDRYIHAAAVKMI